MRALVLLGYKFTVDSGKKTHPPRWQICILAGGLSSRMGRDKSRLRLGRFTVLGLIRRTALQLGLSVRVIREDAVPRCGPLGGVYTALRHARADAVLFLSCDMPFVSVELLQHAIARFEKLRRALFVREGEYAGFPFALRRDDFVIVEQQLAQRTFSLQALAAATHAHCWRAPKPFANALTNVNTPEEWKAALKRWRATGNTQP